VIEVVVRIVERIRSVMQRTSTTPIALSTVVAEQTMAMAVATVAVVV
jgi:hypothetical protein